MERLAIRFVCATEEFIVQTVLEWYVKIVCDAINSVMCGRKKSEDGVLCRPTRHNN